ncbi:hypothetical protein N9M50_03035 [Alphaproteobacteria bacterium]|nr:hypothetical protein [Alphaproteobacteria bacterium]
MKILFRGSGGEFQAHRLDFQDCKYLAEQYKENPKSFLKDNLSGGEGFSSVLFSGIYGPYINDIIFKCDANDKHLTLQESNYKEVGSFSDSELVTQNCVDYFYWTSGKVYGYIDIKDLTVANFDITRLIVEFTQIELSGYAEKYAQIIHSVKYEGYECDFITEDGGQEVYRHLTGYKTVEGEFEDYLIIHDTDTMPNKFNFSLIERIFSSQ